MTFLIKEFVNMVCNKIKLSVKHSKMDERFCYNAHQHDNSFHQYSSGSSDHNAHVHGTLFHNK